MERRLVADVPAGTCLSGGIDSSSIVGVASHLLTAQVPDAVSLGDRLKTFSIVYDGDPIDEREYMDAVLVEVDAEPAFAEPTSERFVEELDQMVWHQDEPIVSTGPYAQWCVMRLAQPKVTVLLNGQGGDELLGGYVPYQYVYLRELLKHRRFGQFAREAWESRDVLKPLVKRRLADRRHSLPIKPLLRPELYDGLEPPKFQRSQDDLKRRLVSDLQTFSLPSLLRYEDRNSMAFSMESRLPFLDQELVDWVLRLPSSAIVDRGWSRAILREGLRGVLTEKVRTRRWKVGFTTPETRWLRARRAVVQGLFRSPEFCARPYWDAPRDRGGVRAVLCRRGRALADLLAGDQRRDLDAGLLRPRRRVAPRRSTRRGTSPASVTSGWPATNERRGRRAGPLHAPRPASPVRAVVRRRQGVRACADPHPAVRRRRFTRLGAARRAAARSSSRAVT